VNKAEKDGVMRMKDFETWLSVKDAADRLGISRQAIHKRQEEGKMGRAVKTRIGWLIDPESVDEAVREQATKRASKDR
jgi:excisionase family DNA binding protein